MATGIQDLESAISRQATGKVFMSQEASPSLKLQKSVEEIRAKLETSKKRKSYAQDVYSVDSQNFAENPFGGKIEVGLLSKTDTEVQMEE